MVYGAIKNIICAICRHADAFAIGILMIVQQLTFDIIVIESVLRSSAAGNLKYVK